MQRVDVDLDVTLTQRVATAVARLEEVFGEPVWDGPREPVDVLIRTILSQSTNDRNRDRAYEELRRRFADWDAVADADPQAIAEAIRSAGLSNQKSVRIREILRWIRGTNGSFDLRGLCQMDVRQAMEWLGQLKGIGVKTVAVVLMFACGRDVFPVDTHVHRIVRRLGFVPPSASAEKTFWLMEPLVPPGKAYSFHINLLRLGRSICLARKPKCEICPLRSLCPFPGLAWSPKGTGGKAGGKKGNRVSE
jgi:endonuclease-3